MQPDGEPGRVGNITHVDAPDRLELACFFIPYDSSDLTAVVLFEATTEFIWPCQWRCQTTSGHVWEYCGIWRCSRCLPCGIADDIGLEERPIGKLDSRLGKCFDGGARFDFDVAAVDGSASPDIGVVAAHSAVDLLVDAVAMGGRRGEVITPTITITLLKAPRLALTLHRSRRGSQPSRDLGSRRDWCDKREISTCFLVSHHGRRYNPTLTRAVPCSSQAALRSGAPAKP